MADEENALMRAVASGNMSALKALITESKQVSDLDVLSGKSGWAPLHEAAYRGFFHDFYVRCMIIDDIKLFLICLCHYDHALLQVMPRWPKLSSMQVRM